MNNLQIYQVAPGKASNILTKMCSILTEEYDPVYQRCTERSWCTETPFCYGQQGCQAGMKATREPYH